MHASRSDTRSRVLSAIAYLALLAAAWAFLASLAGRPGKCERCGGKLRPYRHGDIEWAGSGIEECPRCGWMINRRHRAN